jgi:hypothetical protein
MNIKETATFGLASALLLGCSKYDDGPAFSLASKNNRLCREWELDRLNGQSLSDGQIIWEFEKDGDFKYTYDYDGYNYTALGEWSWEDGKESLELTIDGERIEADISRLTSEELWLEFDGEELEFVAAR